MDQRDPNEMVLAAFFPKNLLLKNLGDWQTFETKILFHTSTRLLRMRGGVPEGDLAKSWEVAPDMKEFTFKLRAGAKFDDGTAITSQIVAFNLRRSFLYGQFSKLYLPLLVAHEDLKSPTSPFGGIETPDAETIKVKFTKPVSTFIEHLDMLSFGIFRPQDVEVSRDEIHPNFKASGLYRLTKMAPEGVVMELNKAHWRSAEPHLIRRIKLIPASEKNEAARVIDGEVDAARCWEGTTEYREAVKKSLPKTDVGPVMFFLGVDFSSPPLKRYPRLARDINIALDRDALVKKVNLELNAAYLPLKGVTGNIDAITEQENKRWTARDQEDARNRLKKDYPEVANGHLPILLAHSGIPRSEIPVRILSEQLNALGLVTKIVKRSLTEMLANVRVGDFSAGFVGHGIDALTPSGALQFLANSDHRHTNLPPTHDLFRFYATLPQARTYEEHVALVKKYNDLNAESGFIIPLLASEMVNIFAARFDVSGMAPHDDNWRVDDLRLK